MTAQSSLARAIPWRIFPIRLRPISRVLILAEFLDTLTTIIGLSIFSQIIESNPLLLKLGGWAPLLLLKISATILIVLVLERVRRWPPFVWFVPVLALLPAVWNSLCILAEVFL